MESLERKRTLSDVFDSDLTVILSRFLSFDDCMASMIKLNKQFNKFFSGGIDFIWKSFFTSEFLHLDYPDHHREENESYHSYFKRSFLMYKRIRLLFKEIIEMTNAVNEEPQHGLLKGFYDRKVDKFIKE